MYIFHFSTFCTSKTEKYINILAVLGCFFLNKVFTFIYRELSILVYQLHYESVLQDIVRAFEGNWESLSRHEVFAKNDIQRLPIFIPFNWNNVNGELSKSIQILLDEFNITDPIQIYHLFRDKN